MPTYHYVAASERFLCEEEPLAEVLRERRDHYRDTAGPLISGWFASRPFWMQSL